MIALESILGDRLNVSVLRRLAASRAGLTGNGVARLLGAHQSSVRKALERLVETGVVTRRDVGHAASYALDERLGMVRDVLIPLFEREDRLRRDLHAQVRLAAAKLVPPARSVLLFGSVARAEPAPRDIDLLVVSPSRADTESIRDLTLSITERITHRFGLPIGLVVIAEPDLRSAPPRSLVTEVKRDGILLAGEIPQSMTVWQRVRTA